MILRAWATLETKSIDDAERTIKGIASTPVTDRQDDIMEPFGAKFSLPLPLLWMHRVDQPIGHIVEAEVTDKGIAITGKIDKGIDYIDRAWELMKRRLVRGLSIGFNAIEALPIKSSTGWGRHIKVWDWLELSAVTIAANQEASIANIKAFDLQQMRAASGTAPLPVVRLGTLPAVVGVNPYVIRKIHPLR